MFGFDILVDRKLKPHLLEVNFAPSLNTDSDLDLDVKSKVPGTGGKENWRRVTGVEWGIEYVVDGVEYRRRRAPYFIAGPKLAVYALDVKRCIMVLEGGSRFLRAYANVS